MEPLDSVNRILARKPYLSLLFRGNTDLSRQFRFEQAKDGQLIPCEIHENRSRALCSRHEPLEEARRSLAGLGSLGGREILWLEGLGNPFIATLAADRLHSGQILILLEADLSLARFLCQTEEMLSLLLRPGVHLFAGPTMEEALYAYLDAIPGDGLKGLRQIKHLPSIKRNESFYMEQRKRLTMMLKARMSDLLTRFEFEKIWLANILINTRHLHRSKPARTIGFYAGMLEGQAAILVSAGPSLKESLEWIARARQGAFLLACDTALRVLLGANISPDAVVCLDAQKQSLWHFLGQDLSATTLICDTVVHPSILRAVRPRKVVFSSTARFLSRADGTIYRETTPGTEFLEDLVGPVGDIQSGGSVATTAFDILRFLGAGHIYLVGQDLAYTGRQIHATGTHHIYGWLTRIHRLSTLEGINQAVIEKRHTGPIAGICGTAVPGDHVLNLYRHWFEDSIPQAGIPVTNCTHSGALIANCEHAIIDPESLPPFRQDPESPFYAKEELAVHVHENTRQLYRDLCLALDRETFDSFFESYPFLLPLRRKADVYFKRNASRLNPERTEALFRKNVREALENLKRRLMICYHDGKHD
ncbi:MAG: motility associated factor glycosyltransferase family protein [Spirochaetales bacterium]|nr:motility associated factor glycosyltransferase family protein [Spirochaetales bacterium]